jgi:nitroreductase
MMTRNEVAKRKVVLENIARRRSVRAFRSDAVPPELVDAILEAGNQAPSPMNRQPWRFVVVSSGHLADRVRRVALTKYKEWLSDLACSAPDRYRSFVRYRSAHDRQDDPIFYSAPLLLFVVAQGESGIASAQLVCANMMLAAVALGLGTCWISMGPRVVEDQALATAFEMQQEERIAGSLAVGYPAELPSAPGKRPPSALWL